MHIEYDIEVDGAYVWFVDDIENIAPECSTEIWPSELRDEIGLIFDKSGKLVGLEVMPASKYLRANLLGQS
jgi:uncharacterized protein YuzE